MKRLAFIIGGVSVFVWGVSGALTACGGDDGVAPTDSDAGNTSSSGGSSSGAASSSGGSSSGSPGDAGPGDGGGEGGGDGGGDGGGGASNPGKVTCGTAECTIGMQICCRSIGGDAGCIDENANCGGGGSEIECDEKADCPNNEVCCGGSFNQDLRCESTNQCDGFGDFAVCKTNAECAGMDGGTCKEWTCPGGRKVRSCVQPFQGCN